MKPLDQCQVLVTPTSYGSQNPTLKTELEALTGTVKYNKTGKPLSSEQLQKLLPGMDGMIAGLDEIDQAALDTAEGLRVIARYGVGYNNVDLEAASARNIIVTNTPGANAGSVAELTVGLILNLVRPILPAVSDTKSGKWPRFKGYSLEGKTVGLVGCGAIGKETAKRLAGFGSKNIAFDIYPDHQFSEDYLLEYTSLDDLLARADIVSLHLPGTPETEGIVNEEFLSKMKLGSWLVNTARGDLVDESALVSALEKGHLAGAGLDVYRKEPPDPDSPLMNMDQVIATPHMGAHSDSATNTMGRMALDECLAVLRGEEPKFKVN
jgi:D-3-phosphoglycerate dehydrogenase